jgi:hypothetical protein
MTTTAHESTHHTPALGLTNMQRAEKRRRIAEIAWERAQLADESTKLRDELKTDADRAK